MSGITEEQKITLTDLLNKLEARTELEACAVVTKEGLRIACAVSADVDADVYSAASAALVNLGETSLRQLKHGGLKEIIVRGDDGYTILTQAGPTHMVVGSCKKMSRMGYYLALLHRFSNKVAKTLGYEEIYETPISPTKPVVVEPAASAPVATEEIPAPISFEQVPPPDSTEQIPAPATVSATEESFDKRALFDALQSLESTETPPTTVETEESVEIDSDALRAALSQKTYPSQPTTQQTRPFTSTETTEDEIFKISDKEAVLEALKVLGWEEPDEEK